MKRSRPKEHKRVINKGKKVITVNKGVKKYSVSPYKRKVNKKIFKVTGYKRKPRQLGKKLRYKPVGTFYVAHDEQGNFRGSKIKTNKKSSTKKKVTGRKKSTFAKNSIDKIDTDYYVGKIDTPTWLNRRKQISK